MAGRLSSVFVLLLVNFHRLSSSLAEESLWDMMSTQTDCCETTTTTKEQTTTSTPTSTPTTTRKITSSTGETTRDSSTSLLSNTTSFPLNTTEGASPAEKKYITNLVIGIIATASGAAVVAVGFFLFLIAKSKAGICGAKMATATVSVA